MKVIQYFEMGFQISERDKLFYLVTRVRKLSICLKNSSTPVSSIENDSFINKIGTGAIQYIEFCIVLVFYMKFYGQQGPRSSLKVGGGGYKLAKWLYYFIIDVTI